MLGIVQQNRFRLMRAAGAELAASEAVSHGDGQCCLGC